MDVFLSLKSLVLSVKGRLWSCLTQTLRDISQAAWPRCPVDSAGWAHPAPSGNLIGYFSDLTRQRGVEPDIRFLALVGKAEIILSVALKNSTLLSLNQTASKSSTLSELGFRLYVENIFTTLSHSLASQFVGRAFSSFDWLQRWIFPPCEPLSFAVLRCKVVNVHGGFRHTCDPFSNIS